MKKISRTVLNHPTATTPSGSPPSATREEVVRLVQDISRLIHQDPGKAAVILTAWLSPSASVATPPRKKAG
jgi:hypothetical protein